MKTEDNTTSKNYGNAKNPHRRAIKRLCVELGVTKKYLKKAGLLLNYRYNKDTHIYEKKLT